MRRGDFQLREEIADQIRALNDMKEMALSYGFDISQPAKQRHTGAFQVKHVEELQGWRDHAVIAPCLK